jgi:prevent-host-death family protein
MTTVRIEELEANLRELMARVESGETVIVSRGDRPVAQLSPCDPLAALAVALPGVRLPTRHLRDIPVQRVPIAPGIDVVEVLREIRDDRDFLR